MGAIPSLHLIDDVLNVVIHRLMADVELLTDLFARQPVDHREDHIPLALGKAAQGLASNGVH